LDEKVLAHAVLANARRLKMDFLGSQEAFQFIDAIKVDKLKPGLHFQVNIFRTLLHWWWKRDVDSSRKMIEPLLAEARRHASPEFLAITLDLAGQIYETGGQADHALAMYEEVVERSRFIDDPFVVFGAHYNVAAMYASLSNGKKASEIFKKVEQLCEDARYSNLGVYVTLLSARIYRANNDLRDAEPAFLEAREGFAGLGLDIYVALTSLELALLYLDLAKPDRAFSMAISSIDCISRYSYHKEAMTALAVLQEASRAATINKVMLRRAWRHLEMVRLDPTSAFWAQ
jgi:tetratricopeptide (TPR) repeat protein